MHEFINYETLEVNGVVNDNADEFLKLWSLFNSVFKVR